MRDLALYEIMDLKHRRALTDTGVIDAPDYGPVGTGFFADGETNQNAAEDSLFVELAWARQAAQKKRAIREWLDQRRFDPFTSEASDMEREIRCIARFGDRTYSR